MLSGFLGKAGGVEGLGEVVSDVRLGASDFLCS